MAAFQDMEEKGYDALVERANSKVAEFITSKNPPACPSNEKHRLGNRFSHFLTPHTSCCFLQVKAPCPKFCCHSSLSLILKHNPGSCFCSVPQRPALIEERSPGICRYFKSPNSSPATSQSATATPACKERCFRSHCGAR